MELINRTPFPAQLMDFSVPIDTASRGTTFTVLPRWTLIAKATFGIRPGGIAAAAKKHVGLAPVDTAALDGASPLLAPRYESDFVPFKPRADCLCVGRAHSPDGVVTSCEVSFGVGSYFEKKILVLGDRSCVPLEGEHVGATSPAAFMSMPVSFANAYGGQDAAANDLTAFFQRNPSGKGYAVSRDTAIGQPLPNLEDPARRLRGWRDRVEPRAFGPVGRTWQPRLGRAGTFDDAWRKQRAPLLPVDFSERYYNAAPEDQQLEQYLRGDEEVRLTNLHPAHPRVSCRLPGVRLRAIVASGAGKSGDGSSMTLRDAATNLDTLWVDADILRLVLVWRARITPQPGDARVLLVHERVGEPPLPVEIYRPVFRTLDAEAAAAERVEADVDREEPEEPAAEDEEPDNEL